MTELLYLNDCYLNEFSTVIKEVDQKNSAVLLAKSAFYPGGGGQPDDKGLLLHGDRTVSVAGLRKEGNALWHMIEGACPPIGSKVHGILDWQRRYSLMRTHTAMHILCGVIWRDYKALVTGGNMEPLAGRMDFEFEHMNAELVKEIEQKVNEEIAYGREIVVSTVSREKAETIPDLIRTKINLLPPGLKEIRIVEIVGLDLQADGGTHVANTKEVGHIKIVDYKSKGKINKRIILQITE